MNLIKNLNKQTKIRLILVIATSITLGIIGIILLLQNSKTPQIILLQEIGSAQYLNIEKIWVETTDKETYLPTQTEIKIPAGSKAHLIFPDNSIMSIAENTQIAINWTKSSTTINQLVGNTWHRIKSIEQQKDYSVETPETIASVRGTVFSVEKINDKTVVNVMKSIVDVKTCQKSKNEEVSESNSAVVLSINTEDCIDKIIKTPADFMQSSWYKENTKIDKIFEEKFNSITQSDLSKEIMKSLNEQKLDEAQTTYDFDKIYNISKPDFIFTTQTIDKTTEENYVLRLKFLSGDELSINGVLITTTHGDINHTLTLNLGENIFKVSAKNKVTNVEKNVEFMILKEEPPRVLGLIAPWVYVAPPVKQTQDPRDIYEEPVDPEPSNTFYAYATNEVSEVMWIDETNADIDGYTILCSISDVPQFPNNNCGWVPSGYNSYIIYPYWGTGTYKVIICQIKDNICINQTDLVRVYVDYNV
jgi:hypothetical protein